ncbi:MAG TPA: vWA domain-containing protein [Vicinamibacterales bacterium]|nr:vWA domain-containing protein [Vicinamibacterales bacterium]
MRKKRGNPLVAILAVIVIAMAVRACEREANEPPREDRTDARLDGELAPTQTVAARDGLAAAIAIDVSGSMADGVAGTGGRQEPKIEIARRAARELVDQFARYAEDHPEESVLLGIYEFSRRRGDPDCRPVIPMGPPDRNQAAAAIGRLEPDGGTPIGQAMITAKQALDATGLTRRHLLLVTDGENTDGYRPERVAAAIARRPESERPSIYFVAFDVEASRFAGIRDHGGLVLSASNAAELNETLDMLLRGRILVER